MHSSSDVKEEKFNTFFLLASQASNAPLKQILCEAFLFKFKESSNFFRVNMVCKLWCESFVEQLGKDDGTTQYHEKFSILLQRSLTHASPSLRQIMYRQLAEAVEAQHNLALSLRPDTHSFTKDNLIGSSAIAKQILTVLTVTGSSYSRSQDILRFITAPFSHTSANDLCFYVRHWVPELLPNNDSDTEAEFKNSFRSVFHDIPDTNDFLDRLAELPPGDKTEILGSEQLEYFKSLHENFWSMPLEVRAYIISELLIPAAKSAANAKAANDEGTRFAIKQLFMIPPNADESTQLRLNAAKEFMECYLQACHPGEKGLIISAVLAAQQRQESNSLEQSVGKRLATIVSELSPVEKKLAQSASYNPKTPEDIRLDLAHITHQDRFPARWDLLEYMKKHVHHTILNRITRINSVVGAASFYITLSYTRNDGEDRVLSLLRPNARNHTINGFSRLYGALENYAIKRAEHHHGIAAVRSIAQSAEQLCEQECDNSFCATTTHPLAYQIYSGKSYTFDNRSPVIMQPITWDTYGLNWRDMPLAPGVHLRHIADPVFAKDAACAIAIDIISQCLSGLAFDCDRHTGQYLIDPDTRTISCFDFGGFCAEPATKEELSDVIIAIQDVLKSIKDQPGKSFDLSTIKLNLQNVQTPYGSRVQRGLLTLGSVTEAVKITDTDWKNIFLHAIQSKSIHPAIQKEVMNSFADIFGVNKIAINAMIATQKTGIKAQRKPTQTYQVPLFLTQEKDTDDRNITQTIHAVLNNL